MRRCNRDLSDCECTPLFLAAAADKGKLWIEDSKIRFDKGILVQIIKIGLPSGVQNSIIAFANVIVQSNINAFGEMAMAGYGAYTKVEGFGFLPINSFTMH